MEKRKINVGILSGKWEFLGFGHIKKVDIRFAGWQELYYLFFWSGSKLWSHNS